MDKERGVNQLFQEGKNGVLRSPLFSTCDTIDHIDEHRARCRCFLSVINIDNEER